MYIIIMTEQIPINLQYIFNGEADNLLTFTDQLPIILSTAKYHRSGAISAAVTAADMQPKFVIEFYLSLDLLGSCACTHLQL